MTLNQLGYFYQAAVLQHFNQAFEKRGRNVILTKAGEIFLEHATQILDDVKRAENKMHHLATDGGHIDIAYVSPLAREYIPRTVRNFLSLEQNKNITFNFNQDITSVNIEGLKKGAYDLIFGSYSSNEPNIEFVPIIKQEIVAILPAGHPLSRKEALQAADFADYQVLGYNRHSGLGKYTRSFFKEHGITPNFICESPDENGIASLVAQGFGIALVADVDTIYRDDICIRPLISSESFSHTVYMGYMRGKYQLPAVQRFIAFVRNVQA